MGRQSKLKSERRAARVIEARAVAARQNERSAQLRQAERDGERRGCLICRQSDGGFSSSEHIVPQSMGNTSAVLPPGVVCDRCNHGVCSYVDEKLATFGPLELLRTIHQVPPKRGGLPSTVFDNGSLTPSGPDEFILSLDHPRWTRPAPSAGAGRNDFVFKAQRGDLTSKRLSAIHRALVKQALEFVWLDYGEDRALSDEFDRERDIVLHGGHTGWIGIERKVAFRERLLTQVQYTHRRRPSDGHPLMVIQCTYWDIPFITDTLLAEPPETPPPTEAGIWRFGPGSVELGDGAPPPA